jgi:hypothetical protein
MLRANPGQTGAATVHRVRLGIEKMKASRTRLSTAAISIAALLATPVAAAAAEEAVVPPSNSAATQYTETFPTSGGDKKTDQKPNHRSPSKVLGTHNTRKLEKQGPEGKAAAETAAATAPTAIATPSSPPQGSSTPGTSNEGGENGSGSGAASAPQHGSGRDDGVVPPPAPEPAGSSGVRAAIEQATGLSTDGPSGPLLPLAILATAIWALAYAWRRRQGAD